jgi:hypothetical protein
MNDVVAFVLKPLTCCRHHSTTSGDGNVAFYTSHNHRRGVGPSSSHETFFSSHCCQSSLEKPLEMPPSTTPYEEVSIMSTTQRISAIITLNRTVGVTCTPVKRLALVRSLMSFVTLLPLFRLPSSPGLSEISRRL